MKGILTSVEASYGSFMTYSAATVNTVVISSQPKEAAWIDSYGIIEWLAVGDHWFLILSALAVLVRLGIDLPKLIKYVSNKD
jgi:hypothetical protein